MNIPMIYLIKKGKVMQLSELIRLLCETIKAKKDELEQLKGDLTSAQTQFENEIKEINNVLRDYTNFTANDTLREVMPEKGKK